MLSNKVPFTMSNSYSSSTCHICPVAKFKRLPFQCHNHFCTKPFDLIHCDVWGPYRHPTYNSMKYFLTLVDDHSRYTWIHLLRTKAEATSAIKSFFSLIQTQFGVTIKQFRSDNAKELALTEFLKEKGTIHQLSCVERPQQNVVVERKHQHLLSVARALYYQSKIPIRFWGDCITTAAFLINRMPSPNTKNISPYNLLYGKDHDYTVLKSFGCLCFAATLNSQRDKFSPRSTTCIFVGYPLGMKGYKLCDI
uniref:Retrovirus-related Pol polyprotein from transposon TNT 1-94 n=2 Tax=Cajanus cajan TaxID=3821 RepID=A0A151TRU9_CAJCA|nr:Retrovirus-related Pol polyprotein from transposon TNT 1-94 [Cajanus cajan]KYP69794.1 Retrovirus-related Pol polyprotein from transposon TNT 1-94 [Cajanus cajan]